MEIVVLGREGVGIAGPGKFAGLMIGPTVGADETFATCYGDGHAIGADLCHDTIFDRAGLWLRERLNDEAGERGCDYERRDKSDFRRDFHAEKLALSTLREG